jgi:DeoD family purine-nucleoside phosphorylase
VSPIHIRAEAGDVAERVLIPGDPRRARHVAETFFHEPRLYSEERGMLGFTGSYEGVPMSVQTTGMGCPSAAIAVEELVMLGAKNVLRVGTCGAYDPRMRLGDLVIATAAAPSDGTMLTYTEGLPYAPAASFEVVHAAFHAAEREGVRTWVGPVVSSDVFYHPERTLWQRWNRFGILGVEMESSAVFTLAAMHGIRAGCLLTVSDTLHTVEFERISDDDLRRAVDGMVRLGLETLRALD